MTDSSHSPIKHVPSTPSRSISTPIIDAFRHAHESATREFDQFYGYISQVMTPRRSQQQQQQQTPHRQYNHHHRQSHIHKTTPKNTTRIKQQLDHQRKSSSSLTPLMANHSIQPTGIQPTRRRQRDYPPPRAMTLTPNTVRTSTTTDNSLLQLNDDDDDGDVDNNSMTNIYLRSPQRSTPSGSRMMKTPLRHQQPYVETPFSLKRHHDPDVLMSTTTTPPPPLPPASPSMYLQDQLLDESRRLDQLQHHFDVVQQRCLALISHHHRSPSTTVRQQQQKQQQKHPYDDPFSNRRRRRHAPDHCNASRPLSSAKRPLLYDEDVNPEARAPRLPSSSTTTPIPSVDRRKSRTAKLFDEPSLPPQQQQQSSVHPRYSIPAVTSTPIPPPPPPPPLPSASAPAPASSTTQDPRTSLHHHVLNDIPKAQLRSAKTITTPNGTRIKNKFWAEIHGDHHDIDNDMDDTSFWMKDNRAHQPKKSDLTDRLEQVKSIETASGSSGSGVSDTRQGHRPQQKKQYQHYPADFFEELTHTLQGKSAANDHSDDEG